MIPVGHLEARERPGASGRAAMASTNEDVVVLATAPLDDGRQLLVVRHLPDRGTVEIGWWDREDGGAVAPGPSVLELAAEAVEVHAVVQLCKWLLAGAGWDTAGEGEALAETPPFVDGAQSRPCVPGMGCCWSGVPRAVTWSCLPGRHLACSPGLSRPCCRSSRRSASAWSSKETKLLPEPPKITPEPVTDWGEV